MNSVTGCMKSKFRPLLSHTSNVKKIYSTGTSANDSDKKASEYVEFHSVSHKDSENLVGEFCKRKKYFVSTDTSKGYCNTAARATARKNDLNIQMLSETLHRQIYGGESQQNQVDKLVIEKAKFELKKHGLWKEEVDLLNEVSLSLPPLKGNNIEEHFWNIGKEQSEPYKNLLSSFCKSGLLNPPEKWICQEGWTKYVDGEEPVSVPFPNDDVLVFDVEVCIQLGELPTLATAVSSTAWYGWICPDLARGIDPVPTKFYKTDMLIPFEGKNTNKKQPRVIIGHNVSYDRARIKEQYYIKNSALRFLDTMSLHNCIGGISTRQRAKFKKKPEEIDSLQSLSCLSSLKEVYSLYCNKVLDKEQRNVFVTGNMSDVRKNFQNLMTYCAGDVKATYEVFSVVFPIFLERFPHPVTLAGMLEMSTAFLPVNSNWNKFLAEAEQTYDDLNSEIMSLLAKKSDNACKLFHKKKYQDDLWMWDEDWSTQTLKLNQRRRRKPKPLKEILTTFDEHELDEMENKLDEKFRYLFDLKDELPLNRPFLPGYPLWYRHLLDKPNSENSEDWTPCPKISTSKFITPKLLRLTWENFPLHYVRLFGWGILVADIYVENPETNIPFKKLKELTMKNCSFDSRDIDRLNMSNWKTSLGKQGPSSNSAVPYYQGAGIWCDHILDNCCYFFKLPHSQGDLRNVGNPLSRDFSHLFFGSFLSSSDAVLEKVVDLENKISYWRNNKERILSQMVVWLNKKEANLCKDEEILPGVIIPKVVVCGTITRRAMEPTWLTASKVTKNRIGSELRSMVQAPPGYHIIGADVDSQELWIASLIGDSHFAKTHGSTPIGWMTLSGTKSKGTDMHSVTAKAVGISRDHAKIINYARIYGAGMSYAKKLLQNFNPAMKDEEAYSKARKMYSLTKGKKVYKVKETMMDKFYKTFGQSVEVTDVRTAVKLARVFNEKPENVFEKCHWINGTESAMFNQLEEIANSAEPRTPFLNCRLSQALEPRHKNDAFSITRINWVVQSGAVDFLHLMLVCMRWLTNGQARYCFSFHDEVRYLLPSESRYNGALAMHITNLLVRAFCAYRVGIHDLPQSVAFFSSVEVDKTLRKEAYDDCVTPSNPHGLEKKYNIPLGESLNIYEAVEKSKGSLAPFNSPKTRYMFIKLCETKSVYTSYMFNSSFKVNANWRQIVKLILTILGFQVHYCLEMSQATKRKYVYKEILEGELELPKENQQIVRVIRGRGSNLHEVETPEQSTFLVSMPSKFRKNVWIKRGDYILVEPIKEGGKVKAEMVKVLTSDHIKYLRKENFWPFNFEKTKEETMVDTEDTGNTIFVNNNHDMVSDDSNSEDETD